MAKYEGAESQTGSSQMTRSRMFARSTQMKTLFGLRRSRLYCVGYLLCAVGLGVFISKHDTIVAGFHYDARTPLQDENGQSATLGVPSDERVSDGLGAERGKAHELADALKQWTKGGIPDAVVRSAEACTPRDIADVVVRGVGGVIDVGASEGYPVTEVALQRPASWVLSIEPDDRSYKRLAMLRPREESTQFIAVRGAASSAVGRARMQFKLSNGNFSCLHCVDTSDLDVFTLDVDTWTLDTLVLQNDLDKAQTQSNLSRIDNDTSPVLLLRIDTHGHELDVLAGATHLLSSARVRYLLFKFDPKLVRKRDRAIETVRLVFDAGMQCAHLKFAEDVSKGSDEERTALRFERAVIPETLETFVDFVISTGRDTDLFCSYRS